LLKAYLTEFRPTDDVALILRVYSIDGASPIRFRDWVQDFIRRQIGIQTRVTPEILFVDEMLTNEEMRGLYEEANAFVLPSRGEGFGRPYLEAIVSGLPTIATRWGG